MIYMVMSILLNYLDNKASRTVDMNIDSYSPMQ